MEHSLQTYLERQPTEVLENFLQSDLSDECSYAIPTIQEILKKRRNNMVLLPLDGVG